ncbi:hypothetical protein BASA81_008823 [Batrachochytrium salamandrivorans]|nr:hypothetical protein BASA81_008823 [Batrachochytrium salamandrivorans]
MVQYSRLLDLLDQHGVQEPVMQVLLWESPVRSLTFLLAGLVLFVLVHVLGIGMLTVVGTVAILQLFVYRTCEALQTKQIFIKPEVNLRELLVVTPDAASISTSIELLGDVLRLLEEEIKEISLNADYVKLGGTVLLLLVCAVVGRFVSLPTLLVCAQLGAFTIPVVYTKNQDKIDQLVQDSWDKVHALLPAALASKGDGEGDDKTKQE